MSYCRMGQDSDVYMYPSVYGGIVCSGCKLTPTGYESVTFRTQEEAIIHLNEHEENGHMTPIYAIKSLEAEIKENIRYLDRPVPTIGDSVITSEGEYKIIEIGEITSGEPFVVSLEGNKVAIIELQWTTPVRTLWIDLQD